MNVMSQAEPALRRRMPIGAEPSGGGTSFRVWAPASAEVSVVLADGREAALAAEEGGYFAGFLPGIGTGDRYRLRLDGNGQLLPDPASRRQPEGPHGPSEVVDPHSYRWRHPQWRGVGIRGQVIYEMHVGTFTPEGSWAAAQAKLPFLRDIGITLIEMMPVNEFAGRFGWGYDGVGLFAPTRLYGTPDELRGFIDAAHGHGIGVILDVVYNHLGPDGNYLPRFSRDYFTDRHDNEWGEAINFDGPNSGPVREFFASNAAFWIDEYCFDGLRLDATQSMQDDSPDHIIAEIARTARAAASGRRIVIVGENEPQETRLVRQPERGGFGLDALWNDDLHHSAMVAVTGRRPAYYQDHRGSPQEFVSAAKHGYLFQGQGYAHQGKRRGTPGLDLPPWTMVSFTQNHDQIANSARGLRLHQRTDPARLRALTGLMLLLPATPMLFQGQEFAASAPFFYFADHGPELAVAVREGRRDFLGQFPAMATAEMQARLTDPASPELFQRCKLDWSEAERHGHACALHRDLLRLRREDPVFAAQGRYGLDGAVLGPEAFLLRFFGEDGDDRLVLVNLGPDLERTSLPEPLLAPPAGRAWQLLWSSESSDHDGGGTPPVENGTGWSILGHATLVLKAQPADQD